MNEYGAFAQRTWRELTPSLYAQIQDPNTYFSELGELAANQVHDLMRQIAGRDQPGETFLHKVGRLNMAKMQAEEMVRADLLTPPEEQWEDEEDSDWISPFEELHQRDRERIRQLEAYYSESDPDLVPKEPPPPW